jgi:hypothetical protein
MNSLSFRRASVRQARLKDATLTMYYSDIDGALVVEIDTAFEPNAVGVRIWLNDEEHTIAIKDRS